MENEEKKETKMSVLEETKKAIEDLKREREEMAKIKDELQQLRSDQLLSGSAGIRQEPEPAKEETAKDYMKRVMSGGLNAKPAETESD